MKTIQKFVSGFILMAAAVAAQAAVIEDNYIGSNDHGYGDVIGEAHYDISSMDVTFGGGMVTVRVNTNFSEATDKYGIQFGDLFISTNGWNPYGSAPYMSDNAATGEKWEFVFDTVDTTVESLAGSLYGGDFGINLSDDLIDASRYIFRNGQEVQRSFGGTALAGSSVDLSHAGTGGYIEYKILLSSLGNINPNMLAFKWGMTCANDTIEGAVSAVPEPASLVLLSLGLAGLGFARKRKLR